MPRYGHRFDTEVIARWFVEYASSYKWLSGHLVRSGRVVGVDGELAAAFNNETATAFVTMTNAFDAGVTLAISRSNQEKENAINSQETLALHKTVLVAKTADGKEVGRIAATAPNASDYLHELARHYGGLKVDYEEDEDYAMVSRMLNTPRG